MPKVTKRELHIMQQSLNQAKLAKLIQIDAYPELDDEELEALKEHRKGNQSHLLRENFVVHKRGLIVTKTIESLKSIPIIISDIIDACNFDFWISIGMVLTT